ncbi:hypothetical protein [Oxalicibacterium solurbis]|uniref:hypothetical protein n=1 Tax=Oxalicibacterium solurbis TaxID=69280 RepID=UPI0016632B6B|nr:hypothetical protein [Oxalicibacterium solurbis]
MKSIFLLPAWLPVVSVLSFALSVHAQPPVPASSADPADAAHSTSAPAYQSAFDSYRGIGETSAPTSPSGNAWRAANDAVNQADMHGGHMQMPSPGKDSPNDAHASHADHQAGHQVEHQSGHEMHGHHHGGEK